MDGKPGNPGLGFEYDNSIQIDREAGLKTHLKRKTRCAQFDLLEVAWRIEVVEIVDAVVEVVVDGVADGIAHLD